LNNCVAQLRSALGESADAPVYVKTAPKKGYQFIAPVEVVEDGTDEVPEQPPAEKPGRRWAVGAGLALVLGGAGWLGWTRLSSAAPVRIAVARFENQTGDAGMDRFTDGLSDALVAELATSPMGTYQVIGNAVSLRGPRAKQDLTRIGEELRAQYIVLGQVQGAAGAGRVLVHLIRFPEQTHLWVTRVENPDFGDAVRTQKDIARRAVSDLAARMRRERE
jgi:TolB-like protein